jgi:hypothetical protein
VGSTLEKADRENQFKSWLKVFQHSPLETGFLIFSSNRPLLTDIGNLHAARIYLNCSGRLIPAIATITASLFPLSDDWLSGISYLQWEHHGNG